MSKIADVVRIQTGYANFLSRSSASPPDWSSLRI